MGKARKDEKRTRRSFSATYCLEPWLGWRGRQVRRGGAVGMVRGNQAVGGWLGDSLHLMFSSGVALGSSVCSGLSTHVGCTLR